MDNKNDKFKVPPVYSDSPEDVEKTQKALEKGQAEFERLKNQGSDGDDDPPPINRGSKKI